MLPRFQENASKSVGRLSPRKCNTPIGRRASRSPRKRPSRAQPFREAESLWNRLVRACEGLALADEGILIPVALDTRNEMEELMEALGPRGSGLCGEQRQ